MFSDHRFCVYGAQNALDLSVAAFVNLRVTQYQWVADQFLQWNALVRQQWMTRWTEITNESLHTD